ncbi:MAG: putative IIA-like nitrogen-regulatory protein PtsN [Caloramator sp.]|jgi:PTS system galactitol-specific IIA component|uniref:PTS sugar transporter subunit IIA n=1 Tax=Caloramator sp. TaxID=1871330 RepID=UPI001DE80B5E|nr:PTS sugar transporter subunit IIA [Caloramator sp.]MBZ4663593.1 putative IIA-like nitrogen-regulatory protein PtsN [Caloramator sp.]
MGLIIDKDLIFIDISFKDYKEALCYLSEELQKKGYVKESFKNAVLKREETFPTGLAFEGYGIAIPHADAEYVNKSTLAFAVLKDEIKFRRMEDEKESVNVKIICMIVLKEKQNQAIFLSKLLDTFSDSNYINRLKNGTKEEISNLLLELNN